MNKYLTNVQQGIYDELESGGQLRFDRWLNRWSLVTASGDRRDVRAATALTVIRVEGIRFRQTGIMDIYTLKQGGSTNETHD